MHASHVAGIVFCAANSAFRVARREFHRRRPYNCPETRGRVGRAAARRCSAEDAV
jgi:hypothetical protein